LLPILFTADKAAGA